MESLHWLSVSDPLIESLLIFQDYYNALADVLKAMNDRYEKKDSGV